MRHVILASQSPRRKELLRKVIGEFRVVPSRIDEGDIKGRGPADFARKAAIAKAKDVAGKYPSSLIIAADTVVCLGREIFGKPRDYADALSMLERLSGTKHKVITAVAFYKKDEGKLLTGLETSTVKFKKLSRSEIIGYLDTKDYLDKAGSYAIQEIGDRFVEELEGDYTNVVGFPVEMVKSLLTKFDNAACRGDQPI